MIKSCRKAVFNKKFLSASCASLLLLSAPVLAQSPSASIPQFVPASGWQIQSTPLAQVRGLENMNLPCMMAASFDNGYIVRFSGNQGKMLAMAIDFRQNVFVQGRKYPANVSVDGTYNKKVTGTAFSQSTLIFNLRELEGFYIAVSDAVKMELNVEDNQMVFALGGINSALKQLEGCASGGEFKKQTGGVQKASLPPQNSNADSAKGRVWAAPQSVTSSDSSRVPMKSHMGAKATGEVWEAKAGDDMREVLEAWAGRADVKLDWQATNAGKVADDVRVQGSFEEAVQTLMARNATALGLDARMRGDNLSTPAVANNHSPQSLLPSLSSGVSHPVSMGNSSLTPMLNEGRVNRSVGVSSSQPSMSASTMMADGGRMGSMSGGGGGGKWSAPAGASLQQILKGWSKKEGVEFIWESNQGFSIIRPLNIGGSYEEALQELLGQYTDLKIRPAAQLNNDPVTGRKTLFVQSSRVL